MFIKSQISLLNNIHMVSEFSSLTCGMVLEVDVIWFHRLYEPL